MTVFFDQDELWEGAEASEIHERIRHHLSKHKFGSATSLLAAAKDKFPIFKKLEEAESKTAQAQASGKEVAAVHGSLSAAKR